MRRRDKPRDAAVADGVEPQAANIRREADLHAGNDRAGIVAKRSHLEDRFGLDDLDVLRGHAEPCRGGANQSFNAAIEHAYDYASASFIGICKHHAGHLEHRQQTLVQRFEIRWPLGVEDTRTQRSARRQRKGRDGQPTKTKLSKCVHHKLLPLLSRSLRARNSSANLALAGEYEQRHASCQRRFDLMRCTAACCA